MKHFLNLISERGTSLQPYSHERYYQCFTHCVWLQMTISNSIMGRRLQSLRNQFSVEKLTNNKTISGRLDNELYRSTILNDAHRHRDMYRICLNTHQTRDVDPIFVQCEATEDGSAFS